MPCDLTCVWDLEARAAEWSPGPGEGAWADAGPRPRPAVRRGTLSGVLVSALGYPPQRCRETGSQTLSPKKGTENKAVRKPGTQASTSRS